MADIEQELSELYESWLTTVSTPIGLEILPTYGAYGREIEYEEFVEAFPKHLTSEDLRANHAAGLPLIREQIVRCKDCQAFIENATKYDDECPHFCTFHGSDAVSPLGFCSWGERFETCDE